MIAYTKEPLQNTLLLQEAEQLKKAGFIDGHQLRFCTEKLKGYSYQSNVFAKAGLFLLGLLMMAACMGFLALLFMNSDSDPFGVYFFICFLLSVFALEFICIKQLRYFGNGLDDAMVVSVLLNATAFIAFVNDSSGNTWAVYFFSFLIAALCAIRYVSRIALIGAVIALLAYTVSLFSLAHMHVSLLPLFLLVLAGACYFTYKKLKAGKQHFIYQHCIHLLYFISLLVFYLACNYMVVREVGITGLSFYDTVPGEIPFAFVFYAFTILCPIAYVYFGLKQKNKTLLWTGLAAIGFSVYTIRYYHSVLPLEIALIFGGLLLFSIAYYGMRKLKGKHEGLSYEEDRFENSEEKNNLEAIAVIESYGLKVNTSQNESPPDFGGGAAGGAGSGGGY